MYKDFVDAYVTEDYSKVGGKFGWADILEEFSSLIETTKSLGIFECWRKIVYLETKIQIINTCLTYLHDFYSKSIAEALVEIGLDFIEYDPEDLELYRKRLKGLDIQARTFIVILNQYYNEYDALNKGNTEEKRTRMDFEKEMAILRKAGYKINIKKIYTFEMCAIINAYIGQHKKAA